MVSGVDSQSAGFAPFDALLLLSYGGPEAPEDVVPFLQNVTKGKGIPEERLREVGEHYYLFDGKSPINDLNRALLASLRKEIESRGGSIPVYWGNRNWAPYLPDTLRDIYDAGHRSVLTIVTSAYSSYSSCQQYQEDLDKAQQELAAEGKELTIDKIRQYYNHPGFADANVDAVAEALRAVEKESARTPGVLPEVVFVTHSIPLTMNEQSGPEGQRYEEQHRDLAQYVIGKIAEQSGIEYPWQLVFCSRSGPPSQPWLEPDVNDALEELAPHNNRVVLAPIGFISDHMEVKFDLDTEAVETAKEQNIELVRAATAGTSPIFVSGLIDLALERARESRGETPERPYVGTISPQPRGCSCCSPTT